MIYPKRKTLSYSPIWTKSSRLLVLYRFISSDKRRMDRNIVRMTSKPTSFVKGCRLNPTSVCWTPSII